MLRAIDSWWFGKTSPVAFGLFRIAMASLAFVNLAMISIDFDAWFTERGFVPWKVVPIYLGSSPRLNLLFGVTDWRITLAVYVVTMIAALLTALGLWTRVSSIVLAVGYVSLHHRNPAILHGGDVVLRLGLMYLALGPAGAACSLDRVLALWKGRAAPSPPQVRIWAQRLMQYNVSLIYFTTVWHKWKGHYWRDGTASWYPEHLAEFERFWLPDFLLENMFFIKLATYGTLVVELAFASLVYYKPFRKYVLLAGVGLHLFIEYSMNIPLFAFLMMSTYLCFFEGDEVSSWAKQMAGRLRRFRGTLFAGAGRSFVPERRAALAALGPFELVEFEDGAPRGASRALSNFGAWVRSPGAWVFGIVPGLWGALLANAARKEAPSKEGMAAGGVR